MWSLEYGVNEVAIVRFKLESTGSLQVANVLYVPELKMNLLSILTMEVDGYTISFGDGRVLIQPKGSSKDSTLVLGAREGKVYSLQGNPIGESKRSRINDQCQWQRTRSR